MQTREWFADSPKQWLHNAYQNKAAGCPRLFCRPQVGGYICSLQLTQMGGLPPVSAMGRTRKDAETNCALAAVSLEQPPPYQQRFVGFRREKGPQYCDESRQTTKLTHMYHATPVPCPERSRFDDPKSIQKKQRQEKEEEKE